MKVNFTTRSIILSAKEMKNASKPNTIEYKELLSVMKDLPDFVIEVNRPHITRNANRGLTYEAMMQYITRIAPNRLEEFKNVVYLDGYPAATKWFRRVFPEYNNQEALYFGFAPAV